MANPLRFQRVPNLVDDAVRGYPRLRAFVDQVGTVLTSLLSRNQVVRSVVGGVEQWSVQLGIAATGGLEYNGAGELTIKLAPSATPILNLTTSGLGFGNQSGNVVLASPVGGANGPPTFRHLTANDIPSLTGVYQPLDADLTAISALTGTNTIYYRSAANTWSAVTIGANMSFAAGVLNAILAGSGVGNIGNGTVNTTGNVTLVAGGNISLVANATTANIVITANVPSVGGAGNISGDTGNLPPAGGSLQIVSPVDSPVTYVSNGTTWFALARGQAPMTPPSTSLFTTTHNANANLTMTQREAWIEFYSTNDVSGVQRRAWTHAVTGNWTLTAATEVQRGQYQGGTMVFGLQIRRASDSHFLEWSRIQSDTQHRLLMQLFNSETSFSGGLSHGDTMSGWWPQKIYWQRITHNTGAASLLFEYSYDGFKWLPLVTYTYDSFLSGFDQLGVLGQNDGSNGVAFANLWHYVLVALP